MFQKTRFVFHISRLLSKWSTNRSSRHGRPEEEEGLAKSKKVISNNIPIPGRKS